MRQAEVITRDSYDYIRLTSMKFDIIILDPPYRMGHIAKLLPLAAEKLSEGGTIICEYEKEAGEPEAPEGTVLRKVYRYGKINAALFVKPVPDDTEEREEL